MNTKKFIAGILACCAVGGIIPSAVYNVPCAVVANAEDEAEYTKGTYEFLKYYNYGDHIEIAGCDNKAVDVEIPAEIEGLPVTNIHADSFFACYDVKSVTIPDSITTISSKAFEYCTMTSVTIPDSVTSIEEAAFMSCPNLTSVIIPESVTSIGWCAFAACPSLTSIEIPESVTDFGPAPFASTAWLKERQNENPLVVVNNILIDGHACSGDVVIPDNITSIVGQAFTGCSSMTSINIPDSVTSIGISAFQSCSGLTSVTIPESVTSIEDLAFRDCRKLISITILNPDCKIEESATTISNSTNYIYNENGGETTVGNFKGTIYGYENSTAQAYAEKYGYAFEVISDSPETPSEITGDANGDNTVDLADAVSIIQHIGNEAKYALSEQGAINADCNGDGKVTGADALEIQKLEAGLIDSLG